MTGIVISGCIKEVSSLLEENYFTVMSIIAALYIGLLAFMYPKIIEIRQNLNNYFLYNHFSKKWYIKIYCYIISAFLIFNLFSIGYSLKLNVCLWIYFNLLLSAVSIILNILIIRKIEEVCFNVPKIINKKIIKNIDYSKDLSEEKYLKNFCSNMNTIQDLILEILHKSVIKQELLEKYLNFFIDGSYEYIKKFYNGRYSSNDKNNYYFQYPLERLLYMNKRIIDDNKADIMCIIQNKLLNLCEKIDKIIKPSKLNIIQDIFHSYLFNSITYAIETKKLDYELIRYIIHIYVDLIKKSKNEGSLYKNMQPNYYLFNNIKKIIDNDYDFNYIRQIREYLQNILFLKEHYFDNDKELYNYAIHYIVGITFDILGYYYYKNNYVAIKDYISNKFVYTFIMFPTNINNIIICVFEKDISIFNNISELEFNEYTKDKEYKYYILFLYLCLIKQQVDIHKQNIDIIRKNKWSQEDKDEWIESEQNYINNLLNKDNDNIEALIKISNNNSYNSYIDNFFNNTELLTLFKIKTENIDEYKDFVTTQIKEIENIDIKQ